MLKKMRKKIKENFALFLYATLIINIGLHPLTQPNFWIINDFFNEISSEWNEHPCGVRFEAQTIDLKEFFPNETAGGKYVNHDCKYAQNVAIIVPYRDRRAHLDKFLDYMHRFLITQNAIHYQIYVVEQKDDGPFNRGTLLNIGYDVVSRIDRTITCFIFHDVDILPLDFRQLYTCSNSPRHLCSYIDKLRYVLMYKNIFGGVVAIQKQLFTAINGFSNAYFGWGGEDDDLFVRIKTNATATNFERYNKIVGRCTMMKHQHNWQESNNRFELLRDAPKRMQHDGLNSLEKIRTLLEVQYNWLHVRIKVRLV